MIRAARDHLAWMFAPSRFLFGENRPDHFRVRGFETIAFIDDPEELAAVNKATGDLFLGGAGNEFLVALLGRKSAFTLDGEEHRLARKVMGHWLTARRMAEQQPEIDAIIARNIDEWRTGGPRDIGDWSRFLTMQILCKIVLGIDDPDRVRKIFRRFEATTGYLANIVSYTRPFWTSKRHPSVGHVVEFLVRRVDNQLYAVIDEVRAQASETPETPLEGLIAAQKEHGYDDVFIRDNIAALLAAGYDTTGSALSWTLYWLGQVGDTGHSAAAYRSEVLRYCPPVEILPRRIAPERMHEACAAAPSVKAAIPTAGDQGPMVSPCVHRVHHDPSLYPDPERFDPNRFEERRGRSPNEYLPFGAGGRMCLGINLGKLIVDRTIEGLRSRDFSVAMKRARFAPIRRNVSIWPAIYLRGRLIPPLKKDTYHD